MGIINQIIIGIIISAASFMLLRNTEWVIRQTGSWGWAERALGTEGGTRLVLKLLFVFGVVLGIMVIFGLHVRFVRWIFSPLFKFPLTQI